MIETNGISFSDLKSSLKKFWELSGKKIDLLIKRHDYKNGSPVFTKNGKYTSMGWTEWTQGFLYGSALLQYEITGDKKYMNWGRDNTHKYMAEHVTHFGVHDHGFNSISTYGNLLRLIKSSKSAAVSSDIDFYQLALKTSGAVQAKRWSPTADGAGYIYSFNGPQSLFADTIRSLRILALSYQLGHRMLDEQDEQISLFGRLIQHAKTTAKYIVFYGDGRDLYDIKGRVAHECLFNTNNGVYRCPNSQQGYSPFSTWTRGLSWIMLGYAEQLEFIETLTDKEFEPFGSKNEIKKTFLKAATATCDYYIGETPVCGIPYWDTGAPALYKINNYLNKKADPFNEHEPVDSSAACIAGQGLIRLGKYLERNERRLSEKYMNAGLKVAYSLFNDPYLSTEPEHEGLILHSVYHRPNNWDMTHPDQKVPNRESSMWGDYHARELGLLLEKIIHQDSYFTFFDI